MKLKLDENPPLQIAIDLRARSHDVHTVGEEGLTGRPDMDVWQAAQREGRLLVTQDLIFRMFGSFSPVLTTELCSSGSNPLVAKT
jgi:predicted nuclease of predicted toxin-antitoxin system